MNVIQGYFVRRALVSRPRATTGTRPLTYDDLTLQAHQRSSGLAVQSFGSNRAFVVPMHLAAFGRRTGQKLPPIVQQKMEAFFGADFSDVQVHSGPEAGAINALAFTQGSNIYFAPGQYNPNSQFGRQLLAHELTHVVQQRAGRVRNPFGSAMAVVQDPMLEAEAERMGARAAAYSMMRQPTMTPQGRGSRDFSIVTQGALGFPLQRAGVAAAPAPVLSAVHDATRDEEGDCGYFTRVRTWHVANPVQGIIVQKVTRKFNVTNIRTGQKLQGRDLTNYVRDPRSCAHASQVLYWEAWVVDAAGTVSDGGDDTFSLCSLIPYSGRGRKVLNNTTKGSFEMKGSAQFYPTPHGPANFGFAQNAVAVAGGLYSRRSRPRNLPAPAAGVVDYKVTVTWDSTRPDPVSTVTTVP